MQNIDPVKSRTLLQGQNSLNMMRRANYPCRQLNNEKIKGVYYLSPLIVDKCSIISAKCVCNIDNGFRKAWNEVCKMGDAYDKALQG